MDAQKVEILIVPFGSDKQKESVVLRDEILRKPLNMEFTEAYLAAEFDHIHVVAVMDNAVVGVIVLQPLNDRVIKMRQVAVKENLQGIGIGRKLVEECERISVARDFQKITMHARDVALPFYKKLNYKVIGDSFIEVGIVHYVMEKDV